MSAYACESGRGSEPEVGWQWCLQMARFHDVTVITRANNRGNIEAALASLPADRPRPDFVYFDGDEFMLWWKGKFKLHRVYYIWWQKNVRKLIERMCRKNEYDLLHHITFAGFRYTAGIWHHGVKCIWGPIGGMESIYWRLLPFRHPKDLLMEVGRNVSNFIQSAPSAAFATRAHDSDLTIVSTKETQEILNEWGVTGTLMPTIGLDLAMFPEGKSYDDSQRRPLRLVFVGQLIWLKGVDMAVEALAASGTDAVLHFIGGGPFRKTIERLVRKRGLDGRVTFSPHIPRAQVLRELGDHDVFLFPSLHDSGGFAVLEAMASGLPVICIDIGGPALSVAEGCGFRIPLGPRCGVIAGLAEKIRFYDAHRDTLEAHGRAARVQVSLNYNWEGKGEQMNELYQQLIEQEGNSNK
ncbi:MAG: glycosyltransferase family 4 protein [Verrucomicrobiota bacterium]